MNAVRPPRLAILGLAAGLTCSPLLAQEATPRRGFSIEITEPENQAVVLGKTKLAARVRIDDIDLLDRVEFVVGDEVVFVDREPPFECTHDFGEQSRSRVIRAVAYHREAVSTFDAIITRKVAFVAVERVSRVVLWVTATDRDGNLLTDLQRDDFEVLENGRAQQILDFYREDRPLTLAILLDSSGSMKEKLREVHQAASAFVDTLRAEDRALLIDFDDSVYLIQDLTSDRDLLKDAIESTEALGGTALYDALHAAYRKIGRIDGRKAIVLLSDGDDTSSQSGHKRVMEEAQSNDSVVFGIGLGGDGGLRKSVLRDFAEATGGRAFFVAKAEELADVYERIAEELRAQYYITYQTTNEEWDGRWMQIRVESARRDVNVRARRGYFAVRQPDP